MSSDSPLFRTREQLEAGGWRLTGNVFVRGDAGRDAGRSAPSGAAGTPAARARYLPLYEAKMLHHFSHRWATYEGAKARETAPGELKDAGFSPLPRYWVPEDAVEQRLAAAGWTRPWLLGWRDIARATDERTCIASLLPRVGVGHTYPLLFLPAHWKEACLLLGNLCSFVLDYIVRQKVGGTHITYHYLQQVPVLSPDCRRRETPWQPGMTLADWLRPRVLELCYTAEDMRPFAEDMGCAGDPFPWDEERRAALRAELDAAFFHLYFPMTPEGKWRRCAGEDDSRYAALTEAFPTPRDAVSFVMETFPGVRKNDMKNYGRYRTKEEIIRNYDEMAKKMVK